MKMAATNIVMTGLRELIMDASMLVVMVIAFRKDSCVTKSPSMEARNVIKRSFLDIFSLGRKYDIPQNRTVAPMALKTKRAIGGICLESAISLHRMMFRPNNMYAPRQAACPVS